jgi:PAS domain S-box-containing protein
MQKWTVGIRRLDWSRANQPGHAGQCKLLHVELVFSYFYLAAPAIKLRRQHSTRQMDLSTAITERRTGRLQNSGLLPALLLAVAYYGGAKTGAALTAGSVPASMFWPPSAVLLAGLLMTPMQGWWLILAAALPAHLMALQSGIPFETGLGWFASNCSAAMLGAACMRHILKQRLRFDAVRPVSLFLFYCAWLAPLASSFLEAALVPMPAWEAGTFWQLWKLRFFSHVVAVLVIVPAMLAWNAGTLATLRKMLLHRLEGGLLVFALLAAGCAVLVAGLRHSDYVPLLLYASLPILLWTAVRFDPFINNMAFLLFAVAALWGGLRGTGAFAEGAYFGNTLSLQLFLIGIAVPLFLLSAAIQERRKAQESLHESEARADGTVDDANRKVGTSTDIDAQKEVEHAQQVLREELERKVVERTVELCLANEALMGEIAWRKQAVEAERMSEARFARVFRLSPDAMSISDGIQGRILDVNDRWQTLFGYRRGEAIGNTASQLHLYTSEKELATVLERSRKTGFVLDLEVKMRDKEGRIRDAVVSGGKIDIGGENRFITILRDVTEQRRAESEVQRQREQLAHLTRVAVLGELSGALAHELNQPLAAILTNAQAALRFMNRQPVDLQEIREILDDIVGEDKRAGEVIRRLRALFMKGEPKMQPLDINALVRDALELTHSDLIERKVAIVLQLGSGLAVVHGDWVQLQQVLLNLIVNACEAMSGGTKKDCRLTLRTDTDMDGNVRITVADTGPGIAPDVIGQVFESFFTTKAHGMGFGLSISRAIIAEHGGRIDAVNNPAGGATFRITMPAWSLP